MSDVLFSMQNITKTYPGVVALDDVTIEFHDGEIHALMGENGAGKSTLIKILSGAVTPDRGSIHVGDQVFSHMTPARSRSLGIEVIYQEFNLMPHLSVAENIFIGNLAGNRGIVNRREIIEKSRKLFEFMGISIDPETRVGDLTVAYMQLVEIAKALSKNAKILVMDEPTAPLTTSEVEILFKIIDILKKQGVTIIYISHRLGEVFRLADRVTVLRDGKKISTNNIADIDSDLLVKEMVGREIKSNVYPQRSNAIGETVLKVENLTGNGVQDISFELHRGEILGLSGLVGAGRTEIMRVLFGADAVESGRILLNGEEVVPKNPNQMVKKGLALIPEDRKRQGAVLALPIYQNISLPNMKQLVRFGVIDKVKESRIVQEQVNALRIATPSTRQLVQNLSGGNQQKVVLAKWMAGGSQIFIFDEPTRGIDVGAKREIYRLMNALCEQGLSIIMISSEMEEIIGMSDRILVLCEGRQAGMLERSEFSQERILQLASGEN